MSASGLGRGRGLTLARSVLARSTERVLLHY
jgi:hypothetical protein